eukprot:1193486-Prorocentrum_minimum.AAC.1
MYVGFNTRRRGGFNARGGKLNAQGGRFNDSVLNVPISNGANRSGAGRLRSEQSAGQRPGAGGSGGNCGDASGAGGGPRLLLPVARPRRGTPAEDAGGPRDGPGGCYGRPGCPRGAGDGDSGAAARA